MNYRQLLNTINNDYIFKLYIAYEVDCTLDEKLDDKAFNKICDMAYAYWCGSSYNDIHHICYATIDTFKDYINNGGSFSLEDIEAKILEY